ncbi:hypothetical protein E2C01_072368 [Portunus trituberculatus]|uniref:Uncharacterized protein n=1 Tax=Portunus trituberculatus TaxID=210409 RepID=A0A5B7I7K4_PORTR|nr:hypothetical protein [Portunus trituberculatus]
MIRDLRQHLAAMRHGHLKSMTSRVQDRYSKFTCVSRLALCRTKMWISANSKQLNDDHWRNDTQAGSPNEPRTNETLPVM